MTNRKYGAFIGELYPDDSRCAEALSVLSSSDGDFFYILHDKDVNEEGFLKKPHIHFVFKPVNPRTLSGLSKSIGIPSNYLEPCHNFRASVRYLIHFDNSDKYQYSSDDVCFGGRSTLSDFLEYLSDAAPKLSDDDMAAAITSYIISCEGGCSFSSVTCWALDNGYYSAFRRGFAIFSMLIKEVNYHASKCKDNSH